MKKLVILLVLLFLPWFIYTQGIQGTIIAQNGESLPFATVYVQKLQLGTASNETGKYQLQLPAGTHQVRFQYLGFTTLEVEIIVGNDYRTYNAVMKEEPLQLQIVEVNDKNEDPAYTIMRRAIAKASYHTQQIDEYTAISYLKGSGRIKDVPALFRKRIIKEMRESGMDTSTAFVSESINEISYKRPNTYHEKVVSVRKIGEDNNTSPNNFINSSFYAPEVNGAISPLSPKAFAYYKFEYLGFFTDHDQIINKIKVIPRSPGDQVFAGTLYIVDQLWNIHSLKLVTSIWGIRFAINQVYNPILDQVWLPITHIYDVTGSLFGFDFEYRYFANISDYNIKVNPDLPNEVLVFDDRLEKEKAKTSDRNFRKKETDEAFSQLNSGQEISRKQLRKVLREYEKQELENAQKDTLEKVVEITNYQVDSQAYTRDSLYWSNIRPIPLTEFEIKGYHRMDSIAIVEEIKAKEDTLENFSNGSVKRKSTAQFKATDLILGGNYRWGKSKKFGLESPLATLHFNTAEGYQIGLPMFVSGRFKSISWSIDPALHYSFARERLNSVVGIHLNTRSSEIRSRWMIEGGRSTPQYNEAGAIDPTLNDIFTLFFERNYLKPYEKQYVHLQWQIDKGLLWKLRFSGELARKRSLKNRTDFVIFDSSKKTYTSNFPDNWELSNTDFQSYNIGILSAHWDFRPWLKYQISDGKKRAIENSSPVFNITIKTTISKLIDGTSNFQFMELGYKDVRNIGIRGTLSVNVSGGIFLNTMNIFLPDFKHFPGNQTFLTNLDPVSSYRMLPYYTYSTRDKYLSYFVNYQWRKFLITQIPLTRVFGWREALFINGLETPSSDHYLELGYTLNYLFRLFRVELVSSWQDFKYQDFGVRIGIAANLESLFN